MRRERDFSDKLDAFIRMYLKWPKLALVLVDIAIINLALFSALMIRFDGAPPAQQFQSYANSILLFTAVHILTFTIFGLYKQIWEYASVPAMLSIAFSTILSMFAVLMAQLAFGSRLPYGVLFIALLLNFILVSGSRFSWRLLREIILKSNGGVRKRALVFGAGDAGETIVREMIRSKKSTYNPIAIVDDDAGKQGMKIHGIKVVGKRDDIPRLVKKLQIDEVIIAAPSAKSPVVRQIVDACKEAGVEYKTLPGVMELIDGEVDIGKIRKIDISDLLGRDPVSFDLKSVASVFNAKRILITGAGGSIGSELCRQIAALGPEMLIIFGQGENSIYEIKMELRKKFPRLNIEVLIASVKDSEKVGAVIKKLKPHVVFHAAAYKHVDIMEDNPEEAFFNNVLGTLNVAQASQKCGVEKFILISSDKAVNPIGVMGASKRLAELLVQGFSSNGFDGQSTTKFMTVRFGNVLGSRGSVVQLFRRQIEEGRKLTVTHPEVRRYFMTIPEASMLIIQAAMMGRGGEIFVLDMGEPIRIVDLAKYLTELSGFDPADFPVEFIGLRPGEKLTEELFFESEKQAKTVHKKIFVAKTEFEHLEKLRRDIMKIGRDGSGVSRSEIRRRMFELINTYS